ncbi:hypothetical protein [Mycoplasma sp. ATU-Cv-508]|uniref:tRNA ligase subunit PheS family protein n=1 Tax=Mycoplasma sp. ATU-Cv-508 TaxID=2048001 RepID=UPI0031F2E52B
MGPYGLPELIWTLENLVNFILEGKYEIRLRPSYFPFTSPSLEMDIKIAGRWTEVLGAGLIARSVFDKAGYQSNQNGFAAGIGLDRLAMVKYQIPDIREFYKNDLRFLSQFRGAEKCFSH